MSGDCYVSHEKKFVAFWSPKCACTAVVRWFLKAENIHLPQGNKKRWLNQNGYVLNYKQAYRLIESKGYKAIYFVRDPYARAVSAYLNKFYIYDKKPLLEFSDLEPFSKGLVKFFNNKKGLPLRYYKGISFIQFLTSVQDLMKEKNAIDPHWDCQLPRDFDLRVSPDFIVKQESFDSDLNELSKYLGLEEIKPGVRNKTTYPESYSESTENLSGVSSVDLLLGKKALHKVNLLTPEAIEIINKIYEEDIRFFEYSRLNA